MTGEEQEILIKAHQALADGLQQQGLLTIPLCGSDASAHEGVPSEQGVVYLVDQTVEAMARHMDDLYLKATHAEHLVVANGFDRILKGREGRCIDGRIVYFHQGTQPCCMRLVAVGKQHMLQLELVGLDQVYQFVVHMTWIDE